jgi:hypothetical protein
LTFDVALSVLVVMQGIIKMARDNRDGQEVWRRWGNTVCGGSDIYSAAAGGEGW